MSGGYGRQRFGRGPWGSAEHRASVRAGQFATGLYQVVRGQLFGRIPTRRFTGEPTSGPLSGANGLVFFSAALLEPSSSNSVDFAGITLSTVTADQYGRPPERSSRLFRFGGGPGFASANPSRTNLALYRTQPDGYEVTGVMIQTTPPGPTTIIKIH